MMDRQSFDDGMSRLRGLFIRKLCERHDRLELLAEALSDGVEPAQAAAQVEAILHKIAGAAGSVGLQTLGEEASRVECLIRDQRAAGICDVKGISAALDTFLDLSLDTCGTVGLATPLPSAQLATAS